MSNPTISYSPHPEATPEQACDIRARAWAYVFRCWREKQTLSKPAAMPDSNIDRKGQVKQAKEATMT